MTARTTSDTDRPYRGRRITWREFYCLLPHLRPANDNRAPAEEAA